MSQTLRLLKHSPSVALLILANHHHNLHLRPEYARVGVPVSISGKRTRVVIESFDSNNEFIPTPYYNNLTFYYDRLDLNEVFGELRLNLTPPLTVAGIVELIASQTGAVFTEDDFVNELIEESIFEIRAKPESLRWVGQTTVVLNQPGVVLPLAEAFPNNVLNGLRPPDHGTDIPLSLVITQPILDGLNYPIDEDVPLSNVIAQPILDGLNYPEQSIEDAILQTTLNGLNYPEA